MSFDPYAPPDAATGARPAAIAWFRVYAALCASVYLLVAALALAAMTSGEAPGTAALGALVASLSLSAFYVATVFVPPRPWGWTMGLVAIAIGLPSCTIVVALPLLAAWRRPAVKAAFRRPPV